MGDSNKVDVLIVGSGAGGGAMAWALAKAGMKVMVLEAGPQYLPEFDYGLSRGDWELQGFPNSSTYSQYTFAKFQRLDPDLSHLQSHSLRYGTLGENRRKGIAYEHVRGVGGSTLHFSGEAHRLHPDSMQMQTRFGVAADWPFDYAELEPYYQKVEAFIGVAGPINQSARWRKTAFPQPAHDLSFASQLVKNKSQRTWEANSLAILSRPKDGRPGCNYCANCYRGCPRKDKGGVDVTFIPSALATGNCKLISNATVTHIVSGKNDYVKSVIYRDIDDEEQKLEVGMIVLSAGAIQTPRLLLNAEIANESGHVGRNLMESQFWVASALHEQPLGTHRGLPVDAVSWDFNAPDAIDDVPGGCRLSVATPQAGLLGPGAYAKRVVKGWGKSHKQAMRDQFGRAISISGSGEFLPNEKTFVDLDPAKKDAFGLPLPRISSFIDETSIKRIEFMREQCHQVLSDIGAEKPFEEVGTYDSFMASHVFGTCRMGEDPEASVVDAWGRSHRWRNLYIADASVFPSSGGGEAPSLTIEALALRSAEKIIARIKSA